MTGLIGKGTVKIKMGTCSMVDRLRGPKILGMSIFDWVASLLGGLLLGYYALGFKTVLSMAVWIVVWIALGVIAHIIAGVDTMFGYYLGLNAKPDRSKKC